MNLGSQPKWLLGALRRGRLSDVNRIVEALNEKGSLDNELLAAVVRFMEGSLRKTNARKYCSSLIHNLVPCERLSGYAVLDLLLWALKVQHESVCALVFEWVVCLLDYSLLPLKCISPLYELLLRRLPDFSPSAGPYLLKILLRISLGREVTPWRIHFIKMKASNPYIRELSDHCASLRPDLFDAAILEAMGAPHRKVNWLYYREKTTQLSAKFEAVWRASKKDYVECLLSPSATFEVPSLHVYEPQRCPCEPLSVIKAGRRPGAPSLNDCFSMKDVYEGIGSLEVPDRTLIILDSPQLYVYLFARDDSPLILERLSLSLHEILIRDFIEARESQELYKRNVSTLGKVVRLQTFFQESFPVMNRFLAEYFSVRWDGKSYFNEILRLLSLVQITDFDELFDCILQPINYHYINTFSFCQKLALIRIIKELIVFWIQFEVPRITVNSNKPSIFPRANLTHVNPYSTIVSLASYLRDLVDLGFEFGASDRDVFLHEIFMMYKIIAQVALNNRFPLKPEPPLSFCYLSLSSSNPLTLDNLMEYLTILRSKIIPLCSEIAKTSNKVDSISAIASQQAKDLDALNAITNDVMAVISLENVYLIRGKSLFKQKYWSIEDEKHRQHLSIVTNLAFVRLANKFASEYSEETGLNFEQVVQEMLKTDSLAYAKYLSTVETVCPSVVEFLRIFELPRKNNYFNSTIQSASTSGVSSYTSKSVITRSRRKRPRFESK